MPPVASPNPVVVTGIGLVTSLGLDTETTWANLKRGRNAARFLEFDTAPGTPRYAGFPVLECDRQRPLDLLLRALRVAMADARLEEAPPDPDRAATVVGYGKGDLGRLARIHAALRDEGPDTEALRDFGSTWPNVGAREVSRLCDFRGPAPAPVAACATGVVAVLRAAALIREGACDLALAGAGDTTLTPIVLGTFRKMGVMAPVGEGDEPGKAVRPWDRGRSGFLVGDGAALLVLEGAEHARKRGVAPYAEIAGGALGSDAFHITGLNPEPSNLAGLIRRALDRAGVAPEEVDHVNLHGTATRDNDPLECRALRRALGGHAETVSCSANKSQIGHLLGAAGAAELAITCLAIRDGFVPPTLNLTDPDPACDLDATPLVGRARPIRAALKLSMGFGGHLAVAVVRQAKGPCREADSHE